MMTVEWKPLVYKFADGRVLDLSDTHQVSNTGLIYNNMRKHVSKDEPKPIMPGGKDNRYRCFGINMQRFTGKNSVKRLRVHRAVACMFVEGYVDGYDVDHIDENIFNNNADNLRWVCPTIHRGKRKLP